MIEALDLAFDLACHMAVIAIGLSLLFRSFDGRSNDDLASAALGATLLLMGVVLMATHMS